VNVHRNQKEIQSKLAKKVASRNRGSRVSAQRSRKTSGCRWSERSHHICERRSAASAGQSDERAAEGCRHTSRRCRRQSSKRWRSTRPSRPSTSGCAGQHAGTAFRNRSRRRRWRRWSVLDINVRGVFATTQAALKHMKDGVASSWSVRPWRACRCARLGLRGTKGSRQDVTQARLERSGVGVSRSTTCSPVDRNRSNPASGDWRYSEAATALDRYGHVDEIARCGVRCRS